MLKTAALALTLLWPVSAYCTADVAPGASTNAALNESVGGIFDYAGDADAYRVKLPLGKNVGFSVQTYCRGKTVSLFDRNFRLIASSTPKDPQQEAWVEHTTKYAGTYFVQVTQRPAPDGYQCGPDGDSPRYILTAIRNCGATRKTLCGMTTGSSTGTGYIWAWNDRAWRVLTVSKPGTYTIVGYGQRGGDIWRAGGAMALRRADTSVITETTRHDGYQCDLGAACIRAKLQPGRYFIVVRMPKLLSPEEYEITVTP